MSRHRPTVQPKQSETVPPAKRFDHVLLVGLLTVLSLRVTITEAPPIPLSAKALMLADPLYSVLISCVLLTLSGLWWLRWLMGRSQAYRCTGVEKGLGILFLAAVLASMFASDKRLAINHTLVFFAPALAGLTLVQLLDRPARVRLVLIFLVVLGMLSTAHGISQLTTENTEMIREYEKDPNSLLQPLGISPHPLQQFMFKHRLYTRGIRSFFTTRNSAACFGLTALFAAMALLSLRPKGNSPGPSHLLAKWTPLLSILILCLGLILSKSKGSLLGLTAGLTGLFLWQRYAAWITTHRRAIVTILMLLGVAGATVLGLYGLHHDRLPGGQSMAVRWQYWHATGRMIIDHPWLGVGPGNFAPWYQHYKIPEALEAVADPHNLPLSILAQYGPLGLIGLFALVLGPGLRPRGDTLPEMDDGNASPWRSQALIASTALITALLILRPLLLPFPPIDNPTVRLYLFVSQRLFPLCLSLGMAWWLLRPTVTGQTFRQATQGIALCGVLAVLIANLTDFAIFEPAILMGVWFLAACGMAQVSEREKDPIPPSRIHSILGGVILLLVTSTVTLLAVRPVTASITWLSQAQEAISRNDVARAQSYYDHATQADPWSSLAPLTAGGAYVALYEDSTVRNPDWLILATEMLTLATQRHPADYRPYERLGQAYELLEDWDLAYTAYLAAAERYPGIARLPLALGQVAEKRREPALARIHYQQAIAIEDRFREAFASLYPQEKTPVSRLGAKNYHLALSRLEVLEASLKE
jgi:O-antigen ligase